MCISLYESHLSKTIIYSAEVQKTFEDGSVKPVHVIGYQNHAENLHFGANAMVIPLPTDAEVGPQNVVDSTMFSGILNKYEDAVKEMKPQFRTNHDSLTKGGPAAAAGFQIFDVGSYTVVLSKSMLAIKEGLKLVPSHKRPEIPLKMMLKLRAQYKDWPIAICCFSGRETSQQNPLFWWYEPKDPTILFAPGLDAHDGEAPKNNPVDRDHTLIFGSYRAESIRNGVGIGYHINKVPEENRWLFTSGIVGSQIIHRKTQNGDFVMPIDYILNSKNPSYVGADQVKISSPKFL